MNAGWGAESGWAAKELACNRQDAGADIGAAHLEALAGAVAAVKERGLRSAVAMGSCSPLGAGLILAEGRIVTSAYNLRWKGRSIRFDDGTERQPTSIVRDPNHELAVAPVGTGSHPRCSLSPIHPAPGQPVLAAVRPGRQPLRLGARCISAVDPDYANCGTVGGSLKRASWFEHAARLPRGATGGQVLDPSGTVLGIKTRRRGDGYCWAMVTGSELRARMSHARETGWLGLWLLPPEMASHLRGAVGLEERPGALVRHEAPDGPAERAGLRRRDVLLRLGGSELGSRLELTEAIARLQPGTAVEVRLLRGFEAVTLRVVPVAASSGSRRHGWIAHGGTRTRRL